MIWVLLGVCVVVSFIFSGIEAGVFSVNRVRLAHRAREGDSAAVVLQKLLEHPDRMLVTVLVVTNLANVTILVLLASSLVAYAGNWGYVLSLVIYLPVYLLGLELLPKSVFRRFPFRALASFAGVLRAIDWVLSPMHWVGSFVQKIMLSGKDSERPRMFIGREDFRYYAEQGEKDGALSKAEREMITNVVDFRGVVARDVMKPLDVTRKLPGSMAVEDFLQATKGGQDRWFLTDDTGKITGIVSVLEVLFERRRDVSVGVYQRRLVSVAPGDPAHSVLRRLRAARGLIALVRTSENAEPMGQIFWEDLIRTLVAAAAKK